jgi:hypothetical protein
VKVAFPATSLAVLLAGSILVQPARGLGPTAFAYYKSPSQCEAALQNLRRKLNEIAKRYPRSKLSPESEPYCTDNPGLPREPPAEPAQSPGASHSQ